MKAIGDGFMVAFGSARRALRCAAAVQVALAGWAELGGDEAVSVRIGLHTGEVIKEADDFFGKNVILASRIAALAKGREILVSSLLKELTRGLRRVRPSALGASVALKGLTGIRQVYDLQWRSGPRAGRAGGSAARSIGGSRAGRATLAESAGSRRLRTVLFADLDSAKDADRLATRSVTGEVTALDGAVLVDLRLRRRRRVLCHQPSAAPARRSRGPSSDRA